MSLTLQTANDYYRELSYTLDPNEIIKWTINRFGIEHITVGTGFGAPGIVLIDLLIKINPKIDIFYIDPGFLFEETYKLKIQLEKYFNTEITRYSTSLSIKGQSEKYGEKLWESNPNLCCNLRKVQPLHLALEKKDVWITGIRKAQTKFRVNSEIIEYDERFNVTKVNPLINWTHEQVWKYIHENNLPYNELHDKGYPSLGCINCTSTVSENEDDRSGRWRGNLKTECGLHYIESTNEIKPIQHGNTK